MSTEAAAGADGETPGAATAAYAAPGWSDFTTLRYRLAFVRWWLANLPDFFRRVDNWPVVAARIGLSSANVRPGPIVTKLRDGTTIVVPASRAAWWPTFEMFCADAYRLADLGQLPVGPGEVVLDVGAHVGTAAVLLGRQFPDATIVAYEPNPEAFSYLAENLEANAVRSLAHAAGVSSASGRTTLFGGQSASCEASTTAKVPGSEVEVEVVSFDAAVAAAPGPVRVVKLDCEGAEHAILAGASPSSWSDVELVLLEYHALPGTELGWASLERSLHALGFKTLWHEPFSWQPTLGMAAFRRFAPPGAPVQS